MGSLGDVIRGMSVVSQLKDNFSGTKIAWIVEPKCLGILKLNSSVDRIILFERGKSGAIKKLFDELGKEKFDLILDLQRHFKSGLVTLLAKITSRTTASVGFHRHNSKEFNWIFHLISGGKSIRSFPELTPKLEHYLAFIEAVGGKIKEPINFGVEGQAGLELTRRISSLGKFVVMVMGSSWESKNWFLSGYFRLAQLILSEGLPVVLVGDKTQLMEAEELEKQLHISSASKSVVNFVGKTSLSELTAIIDASAACVGPDSGPAHLAGALHRPYVSLFGPTSPRKVAPFGSEHLVVASPIGCAPCYRRLCPGLNKACMRLLSPERAFAMLKTALYSNPNRYEVD